MSQPIIVHFPSLTLGGPAPIDEGPAGALLLEPGLRKEPDPGLFLVPENLPMGHREARAWLAQSLEYADRFRHRGDLSAQSATGVEDFYSGTSHDIESRLRSMGRSGTAPGAPSGAAPAAGEADPVAQARHQARTRAQMVLLLAAGLEERLGEIRDLNRKLGDSWRGMAESLGLDEEEGETRFSHLQAVAPASPDPASWLREYGLSWPLVLESFFCFVPADALLLATDPALPAAWTDMGLRLSLMAEPPAALTEAGMGARALSGRAPGHVWSGRDPVPADMPWLAAERTIVYVPAGDAPGETS